MPMPFQLFIATETDSPDRVQHSYDQSSIPTANGYDSFRAIPHSTSDKEAVKRVLFTDKVVKFNESENTSGPNAEYASANRELSVAVSQPMNSMIVLKSDEDLNADEQKGKREILYTIDMIQYAEEVME